METNPRTGKGWSDREEEIIAQIMAEESYTRIQAIQAMRRRKLDDLRGGASPCQNSGTPSPGSPVGVLMQRIVEKRSGIGSEEARVQANELLERAAGKKLYRMPVVLSVEEEQAQRERLRQRFRASQELRAAA